MANAMYGLSPLGLIQHSLSPVAEVTPSGLMNFNACGVNLTLRLWSHHEMSKIEAQLRSTGLASTRDSPMWFIEGENYDPKIYKGGIEDDHIPFLHRGVEILHIIPVHKPRLDLA